MSLKPPCTVSLFPGKEHLLRVINSVLNLFGTPSELHLATGTGNNIVYDVLTLFLVNFGTPGTLAGLPPLASVLKGCNKKGFQGFQNPKKPGGGGS